MFRAKPIYYDFRASVACHDSECDCCGGSIQEGDRIGYERRYGALCTECFGRWSADATEEFELAMNGSL